MNFWEKVLINTTAAVLFPIAAPILLVAEVLKPSASTSTSDEDTVAAARAAEREARRAAEQQRIAAETRAALRGALEGGVFAPGAAQGYACAFERLAGFAAGDEATPGQPLPWELGLLAGAAGHNSAWATALAALATLGRAESPPLDPALVSAAQAVAGLAEEMKLLRRLAAHYGEAG